MILHIRQLSFPPEKTEPEPGSKEGWEWWWGGGEGGGGSGSDDGSGEVENFT